MPVRCDRRTEILSRLRDASPALGHGLPMNATRQLDAMIVVGEGVFAHPPAGGLAWAPPTVDSASHMITYTVMMIEHTLAIRH